MTVPTRTFSDGTVLAHNDRGTARMSQIKPGVLLYVCSGYYQQEFYQPMVAPAQRELDLHGRLVMLVDGAELSSVDTAYREAWTAWFKQHKANCRMTLLVRSRLMEMAASLANLFTGANVITTYSKVADWEQACAADVPGFRRRSVPVVRARQRPTLTRGGPVLPTQTGPLQWTGVGLRDELGPGADPHVDREHPPQARTKPGDRAHRRG